MIVKSYDRYEFSKMLRKHDHIESFTDNAVHALYDYFHAKSAKFDHKPFEFSDRTALAICLNWKEYDTVGDAIHDFDHGNVDTVHDLAHEAVVITGFKGDNVLVCHNMRRCGRNIHMFFEPPSRLKEYSTG